MQGGGEVIVDLEIVFIGLVVDDAVVIGVSGGDDVGIRVASDGSGVRAGGAGALRGSPRITLNSTTLQIADRGSRRALDGGAGAKRGYPRITSNKPSRSWPGAYGAAGCVSCIPACGAAVR